MLGKVKYLCEEYITIRGDVPYCLEVDYAVPDSLRPHMKDIMEDFFVPIVYLAERPLLTEDYQECFIIIEKNTDHMFDDWKRDYILYPTEKDQLWLKNNPFPLK